MANKIAIGIQDFEKLRENKYFYVDKTSMIQEWWESGDEVTLITRPRRFGKTLNMSMLEKFFSLEYANRSDLFEGLSIWKERQFMKKKWIIVLLVIVVIIGVSYFLTNFSAKHEFLINGSNVADIDTEKIGEMIAKEKKLEDGWQLCVNEGNELMFTSNFKWANDGAIQFFYKKNQKTYSAQLRMFHDENKYFITDSSKWIEQGQSFKLFHYLDALKYMPQKEIRKLSPNADGYSIIQVQDGTPSDYKRVLKYSQNGMDENSGSNIHLIVQPLYKVPEGGYNGFGDEAIHIFYFIENTI